MTGFRETFRLQNIPQNDIAPVLLIECPRLLFPFARQIVADAVRNGGFPPLFIDPIDFHQLYVQRAQAEAKDGGAHHQQPGGGDLETGQQHGFQHSFRERGDVGRGRAPQLCARRADGQDIV